MNSIEQALFNMKSQACNLLLAADSRPQEGGLSAARCTLTHGTARARSTLRQLKACSARLLHWQDGICLPRL